MLNCLVDLFNSRNSVLGNVCVDDADYLSCLTLCPSSLYRRGEMWRGIRDTPLCYVGSSPYVGLVYHS